MVSEQKYTVVKATRSVGVSDQAMSNWIDRFAPDENTGQLVDMDDESHKLREELQLVLADGQQSKAEEEIENGSKLSYSNQLHKS